MRADRIAGRSPGAACVLVLPLLAIVTGCEEQGDTVNINGLDCGLVREDLTGDWALTFDPGIRTLVNCDPGGPPPGTEVDVNEFTTVYTDIITFASPSGVSFDVVGAGPDLANELMVSVEADSCLALVQKWENDDSGWVQCIGTLDLASKTIAAVCDSMDLETDLVPPGETGAADVACDLSDPVTLQVFISP